MLATGGLLWFFLVYRCKESLQFIVDKESKGRYAFDARDVTVSLRQGSIRLTGAVLYCRDTLQTDAWYNVRIPEAYLSITSWKVLLFQKKIIVDSLSIVRPFIDMHVLRTGARKTHVDFRASDILDYLDTALVHFNVHAFSLKDASFTYRGTDSPEPLHGDHISLSVSNFTGVNNEDSHLLGSDKVSLTMGRQHWALSGGKHEIDFGGLRFDSKGQRFELDSFAFRQRADSGRGEIRLQADKFFFNSRHLPAIYQKEELLLDTVTCVNPVLTLPAYTGEKASKDSAGKARYRNSLFKHINVRFISIVDGDLVVQSKKQESASTRKANLSVFNLDLNPLRDPPLSTDSVRINLKSIGFLTRDSLYKLSIGEFTIHGTDAVFRDVAYEPTQPGRSDKEVRFTAPALVLRDISIGDLLQRHVRASTAELVRPAITMYDRKKDTAAATGAKPTATATKMALFYKTLHNVSELIDVEDFRITHGAARYKSTGPKPLEGEVSDLNAHILLNNFFVSDSLVDIKHAIPDWQIADMNLVSGGLRVGVHHYHFNGLRRISLGEAFDLLTPQGLHIRGTNFYWSVLDWDVYQKTKAIQIDSLHVDELVIEDSAARGGAVAAASPGATGSAPPPREPKDLPVIRVGKIDVDRIVIRKGSGKNPIFADVGRLSAQGVRSTTRFFSWDKASFRFSDVAIGNQVRIGQGAFDANSGATMTSLQYRSDKLQLTVPRLELEMYCPSSDISQLSVRSLRFDQGAVSYASRTSGDTLLADATLYARIGHVRLSGLGKGQKPSLSAGVSLGWEDGRLTYRKGGVVVQAEGLEGSLAQDTLNLASGLKLRWQPLVEAATLVKGSARYENKQVTAQAGRCAWDPINSVLTVSDFSVNPRLGQAASFASARWQNDYITVSGQSVSLRGLRLPDPAGDSTLKVHSLILDHVSLTASRDKNIPFQHGIEKPMPTRLIDRIPFPVSVDSILLYSDTVTYRELAVSTQLWSTIPIQGISGSITRLRSRDNREDTLRIRVSGHMFGGFIHRFSYQESYGDSLSAFTAGSAVSPVDLTHFSSVSVPAAAVRVTGGRADTVFSSWTGNKYATYGTMNFYYDGLQIRVLDRRNLHRRGIVQTLETVLANVLLPTSRRKAAVIYLERDREKFVFNYWVKAQASGLMSTLGLKKGRKYRNRVKTAVGSGTRT